MSNYTIYNCLPLGIGGLDVPGGQPGCKPVLKFLESYTINYFGDGSKCKPLGLEVKISEKEGNVITVEDDGLFSPSMDTTLSTWTGSSNLTTLGTITTGTWNGSPISNNYGGAPTGGTTNQILQKNSNTDYDYSWSTITIPTVSEPQGQVIFGTGTGIGSSSNLFWDNVNNRLGIGTAAPTHPITLSSTTSLGKGIALYTTVDQTTNFRRNKVNVSGNEFQFAIENGGTYVGGGYFNFKHQTEDLFLIERNQTTVCNNLLFGTDNAYTIGRVSSSPYRPGNMLLGTSLQVGSPANTPIAARVHIGASTTTLPSLRLETGAVVLTPSNGDVWKTTDGINVNDSLNLFGALRLNADADVNHRTATDSGIPYGFSFKNAGDTERAFVKLNRGSGEFKIGTGIGGYYQTFHTANTERMRIDYDGNIGIGVTTPTSQLHLKYIDKNGISLDNSSGQQLYIRSNGAALDIGNTVSGVHFRAYTSNVTELLQAEVRIVNKISVGYNSVPTAFVDIAGSTTTAASLRIRSGVAPTMPNDGNVWYDGVGLFFRKGAESIDLLGNSNAYGIKDMFKVGDISKPQNGDLNYINSSIIGKSKLDVNVEIQGVALPYNDAAQRSFTLDAEPSVTGTIILNSQFDANENVRIYW